MELTNEQAHKLWDIFKSIADEYNENGFLDCSIPNLKVNQTTLQECLSLFKFLKDKAPKTFPEKAMIDLGKMLIRLSSLIENGRKETNEEFSNWIKLYL
jgi:hypothetical protein